ncbi:RagB/SusD family nutrient uptake outer membrane protein [Salegentibacter sp. T436]|uniref:RagB/SusD family nutrient uptake outer membrane protein n=1 Tax=Salegentibacter sp. T436 TaxID=1729720 RepID=UPI000A6B1C08|nr:RagB/SusD family nutrient uptake outer membrane protein [Salegentibacter sp. T436]
MNNLKINIFLVFLVISLTSCEKDFLEVNPKAVLTEDQLQKPEQLDGFVTAAYAFMPRSHAFETYNPFIASLRSDDAYKGGGGLNDQTPWYQMEVFTLVNASVGNNDNAWYRAYQGISRTNTAIRAIQNVDEEQYPQKQERLAEMRFIRGWIHFKMKRRWKWIPYIDESATAEEIPQISNRSENMPNDLPLWEKIAEDFQFAAENLPPTQEEVGRANQFAAKAYLAKTLLWMAYPQDENHQVTGVDTEKLSEALIHINDIIESGIYNLSSDFAHNFMLEYDNASPESIWELQFTIDDGTPRGNLNEGNGLTAPWWNPYFSCCDFHKASYNIVNAFQVDENGIPRFEDFNESELEGNYEEYFDNNSFDPRLGHTVAIPGFPWKYQEIPFDSTASRDPGIYGYMNSMKENVRTDSPGLWDEFWMFNSKNQIEIRYAEVLLWKSEILIQLGQHQDALPIINELRERASNSVEKLKLPDGSFPAHYRVEPYVDGVNINWNAETAWDALVWENRLELAMEGRRFFDLVRWGIAEEVMNEYFEEESQRRPWLEVGRFTSGRDEYLPIPQEQMNWSQGVYVQNPGY